MDKAYKYAKSAIVNFKLDTCCCFAPIRIGLLIVGYFDLFIALLSLIGTADGGVTPPLMEVQDTLLEEEEVSMTAGIFAYACELGFSVVLLCAMYRNDIALLRVHIYFTMATVVTSVLMYSMVIAKVSLLTKITIISNIVFNCYVILLVRSAIVEIKERQSVEKNGHVVLYSVAEAPDEDDRKVVEIKPIADTNEHEKDLKIEVISETSKKDPKNTIELVKNDKDAAESKKLNKIAKESAKNDKNGAKSKKINIVAIDSVKNDKSGVKNDKSGVKNDKNGVESKKLDKTPIEPVKNDKNDKESKKDAKIGEASTSSDKVDETRVKLETVNENPKEEKTCTLNI